MLVGSTGREPAPGAAARALFPGPGISSTTHRRCPLSIATLDHDVQPVAPAVAPLTPFDRCDASAVVGGANGRSERGACGAQAFVRAVLPSGQDLVFCAHHGRQHEAALAAAGARIRDESDTIDA